MTRRWRGDSVQGGQRVIIAVLALATIASGLLAARAGAAERARARMAEQSLRQLAATAAWQYTRRASEDVLHAARMVVGPVVRSTVRTDGVLPDAPALVRVPSSMGCDCPRVDDPQTVVRLDLRSGELRTWGTPVDSGRSVWLQTTLREFAGSPSGASDAERMGLWLVEPNAGGAAEGAGVLIAATLRATDAGPVGVYGGITSLASLIALLDSSAHAAALLPDAVTHGLPADSVVVLTFIGRDRRPFHRTPLSATPTRFAAADSLTGPARGLLVEAALLPRAVAAAGLDTSGAAGTPILAGLFLLSAALMGVAFVQHRRGGALLRLREDFIASVSHELRTPLALIRSHTETLWLEREANRAERQAFLGVVLREAHRLGGLVDNVLRFSTSERIAARLTARVVDVGSVVASAVRDFEPLATARGSRLQLVGAHDGNVDARALADEHAVRQIVFNLLDNAVKYGPEHQTVTVRVSALADSITLIVDDEGPGIPATDRDRVFDRYVRLDAERAPERTGGGIGLTVVRELSERYGGRATAVENEAGGACLRVTLPAAPHVMS